MGSGPQWDAYKRVKGMGDYVHESVVKSDDKLNPGGGGCIWEPGQPESSAICTPLNGGHDMIPSNTNARGQYDYKPPKENTEMKAIKRFIG